MPKESLRCNPNSYQVEANHEFSLASFPTHFREDLYESDKDYSNQLEYIRKELEEEGEKLYAGKQAGVLVILQGMDTSGKDGVFRNVFGGIAAPHDFKAPTKEELSEHFLERIKRKTPEKGEFTVFNRSQYEDVLIVYVHPELLEKRIPPPTKKPPAIWKMRYEEIEQFETDLAKKGIVVLKFMLNISEKEQLERLEARVEDPEKHYKVNAGDFVERKFWDKYMQAYSKALSATSTSDAPWYVVPADDKKAARLFIGHVVLEKIKSLGLTFPKLSAAEQKRFRELVAEAKEEDKA